MIGVAFPCDCVLSTPVFLSYPLCAFITLKMWLGKLWILDLSSHGSHFVFLMLFLLQIGVWNSNTGLNLTENSKESSTNVTDSMANRTLIVTTILVQNKNKD